MKTIKKILVIAFVIIGILSFNKVQADFETFYGEQQYSGGRYMPYKQAGHSGVFFCIEGKAHNRATMSRGRTPGEVDGDYTSCSNPQPEWKGTLRSVKWTKGSQLPMQYYQDTAYILATANDSQAGEFDIRIDRMETQYAVWATPINTGVKEDPNELAIEAAAYKSFYEYIHNVEPKYGMISGSGSSFGSGGEGDTDSSLGGTEITSNRLISYINIAEVVDEKNINVNDYTLKEFQNKITAEISRQFQSSLRRGMTDTEKRRLNTYSKQYYDRNYDIDEYESVYDKRTNISYNGVAEFVKNESISVRDYSKNEFKNLILDLYIDRIWDVYGRDIKSVETQAVKKYSEDYYNDHSNDAVDSNNTTGIKYSDIVSMIEDKRIDPVDYELEELQDYLIELFEDKIFEEQNRNIKKAEKNIIKKYTEQFYRRHLYDDNLDNDELHIRESINLSYKGVAQKVDEEDLYLEDFTVGEFQDYILSLYEDEVAEKFGRYVTDKEIKEIKKYAREYYNNRGSDYGDNANDDYYYGDNANDDYDYDDYDDELSTPNIINNKTGQGDEADVYTKLLKNKTDMDNVLNMVKRDDGYYVVGPFNISYPDGSYDGINKFSWISNVTVYDQNKRAIANVLDRSLRIIDEDGDLIYDTDKDGNRLNVPKNEEDFYIKFYSRDVLKINIKVDFGYLESCPVEAYQYNGRFYNWYWTQQDTGEIHEIPYWCSNCEEYHTEYHCNYIKYILQKSAGASAQMYMQVLNATKRYKTASLNIPYKKERQDVIDLTMSIEGKVFLDEDQGKANEGNNTYDKGEELEGIDVWLYDSDNKFQAITLTDKNGNYKFKGLNAMKQYYVRFVYNGMLYTNVEYKSEGKENSKATELAQGHSNNRIDFNNKFAEVASYPQNYKTKDCITGANITNKVFEQGDIVTLFKEVAKAMKDKNGNQKSAYQSVINAHSDDSEIQAKVQYIADCRMSAYTVEKYSKYTASKIDPIEDKVVAGVRYKKIYYEQFYVNLGIKARPTFDLALYKDTVKADVAINGKNETYTYDERKDTTGNGFTIGVSESDYLNSVREAYLTTNNYDNPSTRALETDTYDTDLRAEEVANNQVTDYIDQGKKVDQKYNVKGTNQYSNYTNLDLQNGENKEDRLKIFVQYRLAIRNQSGIIGAVTEVVDYFDTNFKFVDAYEGDKNGNKIANVNKFDTSMYGTGTEYKNNDKYTTIYLRPEKENRLHNDNKEQYIYVTLQLLGVQNDAGDFLKGSLLDDKTVSVLNVAEINGYKTYDALQGNSTPGLVDIDSNPGNFNISNIKALNEENIKKYADIYEDDTSRAPAMIYKLLESRTIEGTVFEDSTGKNSDKLNTAKVREGNGILDKGEKGIKDVIVQLVEIKNGKMITRAQTRTNNDGWYGFTGFIPGNYTIRYIYGADDQTAMATNSWYAGSNETSYNGQDYQSTKFTSTEGGNLTDKAYKTDEDLINRYKSNYENKDNTNKPIESTVNVLENTTIRQYQDAFYWYTNTNTAYSDAQDDDYRRQLVINYSKGEYNTEIANYKADVFNSYLPKDKQPSYMTNEYMRQLANELERRTYRYAYTPEITVEVEYAKRTDTGNKSNKKGYEHAIKGVDFGIVERPKSKIELTKNVSHLKVKASDGTVLFDTSEKTNNLAWTVKKNRYKDTDPILITMDDELLNGATVEITYKFTVTNQSELGEEGNSVISAKTIIDYVDNSLTFNIEDNRGMWEVVSPDSIQNDTKSTLVNNNTKSGAKAKDIDLSTMQTIVKTTENNPLTKNLAVGETTEGTLVLRKVLATESDIAQLTYDNIAEIVEIKQVVGRYDHTSIPGNQDPEGRNAEDDTYRAETVKILPPFGSTSVTIYFVIGVIALTILGGGVFLIKKYVVHK